MLEEELHSLEVPTTTKIEGGTGSSAPWSTMCRVNLKSHIASRILWEVGQSPYKTELDVYKAAYALAWPNGSLHSDDQGEGQRPTMSSPQPGFSDSPYRRMLSAMSSSRLRVGGPA
ncbi:MAG: THUMP domain-containing protein [Nitrospira sp.]